ncbi:ml domain-containing protein [Gigaspora margarita]|uniref:Ml domain-containing protein n=1 Tax=Gigaspora margarita TaxID=4874 RepID=A0A8H3ZV36_GIGMA|nr:ml domain-containing protein [Gigaspora margarita]
MSPGHNINDNPTTNSNMNSYIVHVGEQTFSLLRSSITYDSPNLFSYTFLREEANSGDAEINNSAEADSFVSGSDGPGKDNDPSAVVENPTAHKGKSGTHTQNYFSSNSSITIDRDPKLFEIILRYLRGYNIFPLSSVNLPPGMSLDLFRESLLEDARFYRLDRLAQLLQAETPTPLCYKDPFTSAEKILLSLRDVPIHKEIIKPKLDGSSTIEFFTGAVLTIELEPSDSSSDVSIRLDRIQPYTTDGNQISSDTIDNNQNCDNLNGVIPSDSNGVELTVRNGQEDIERPNDNANRTNTVEEVDDHSHSEESNVSSVTNANEGNMVYLGVVWAKGWTQEWWAWNEYRMKLDALQ